ncbi:MAG: hypothetical protein GX493_04240 [Firmicutes bacterium]|nr:hypothetical protein [Bacillota bacterium]
MAIPEHEGYRPELASRLDRLRAEIGELRRELTEEAYAAEETIAEMDEESYRLATQIDLLVTKFLRLFGRAQ